MQFLFITAVSILLTFSIQPEPVTTVDPSRLINREYVFIQEILASKVIELKSGKPFYDDSHAANLVDRLLLAHDSPLDLRTTAITVRSSVWVQHELGGFSQEMQEASIDILVGIACSTYHRAFVQWDAIEVDENARSVQMIAPRSGYMDGVILSPEEVVEAEKEYQIRYKAAAESMRAHSMKYLHKRLLDKVTQDFETMLIKMHADVSEESWDYLLTVLEQISEQDGHDYSTIFNIEAE